MILDHVIQDRAMQDSSNQISRHIPNGTLYGRSSCANTKSKLPHGLIAQNKFKRFYYCTYSVTVGKFVKDRDSDVAKVW